jgi:uncharacterized tellurite resistance protein B-like protein
VKSLIRSWLGVDSDDSRAEHGALGELLDALDRLEPVRARYLARFAYLLGRVAHADQHVSPDETRTMEQLIATEGELETEQAMLVVALAKSSNLLLGGTDNFLVARDFATETTHAQKLALLRCLFAVSAIESNISISEEREIQRIARELRVEQPEVVALRLEYRRHLPGLTNPTRE